MDFIHPFLRELGCIAFLRFPSVEMGRAGIGKESSSREKRLLGKLLAGKEQHCWPESLKIFYVSLEAG